MHPSNPTPLPLPDPITSSPLMPSHPHPSKTLETPLPTACYVTSLWLRWRPNSNSMVHQCPSSPPSFHLPRRLLAKVREGPEDHAPQPPLLETLYSIVRSHLPNGQP
ncbi:hypothetical protein ACFX12_041506 [Malus domestica]